MSKINAAGLLAGALAAAFCTAALAKKQDPGDRVVVPLVAAPLASDQLERRTVKAGEPFMQRRLTALKSITLTTEVVVPAPTGKAAIPAGARLIYAKGSRSDYYCGTYAPALPGWAGGAYKFQWLCFQDADADGVLDNAYLTPLNTGAFLPSFDRVGAARPVRATYTADSQPTYFETAITHQKSFNLSGRMFFFQKVRREGEEEWHDVASSSRGVEGGLVSVPSTGLPRQADLGGASFEVVAATPTDVTVKPEAVRTGVVFFGLRSNLGQRR